MTLCLSLYDEEVGLERLRKLFKVVTLGYSEVV